MTAAFEPVTVVEEFVNQLLSADATITTAIGANNIWPAFSPVDVAGTHVTQDFAGPDGGIAAIPMGQAIALLTLRWDVTAWTPGMDRQVLRPAMKAVQAALTGPSIIGKRFNFTSGDGSLWAIACRYMGPVLVPADVGPTGIWQRVSGRFSIELRQR